MKPVKILTDYQKQFIQDNFKTKTDDEIGEALGLKGNWVLQYRGREGMKKKNRKAKVVSMKDEVFFNVDKRWAWL